MATRRVADVERALVHKGMERDESHHHMFRKTIEGVTHVVTRTSHSGGEIGDGLGKLMANQLCLRLREFWDLIDCPLSEERSGTLLSVTVLATVRTHSFAEADPAFYRTVYRTRDFCHQLGPTAP